MQKHINYLDFFQFFLHIPLTLFEDLNDETILSSCIDLDLIPLSIIRDKNHPLFKRISKEFKKKKTIEPVKIIVLAIGYNNQYLS